MKNKPRQVCVSEEEWNKLDAESRQFLSKHAELKAKFSRRNFRGIACHHGGTFEDLRTLGLTEQLHYYPIGLKEFPCNEVGQRDEFTFQDRPEGSTKSCDMPLRSRG